MRKIIFRALGVGLMIGGFVFLIGSSYEKYQSAKTETFDTISVDEALDYFQECKFKRDGLFRSREHSFGAWELECKWREE